MDYIEQLERAQRERGLNDLEFAVAADLAPRTISRIKKRERKVVLETLDRAAGAVGMQVIIKLIPKSVSSPANG